MRAGADRSPDEVVAAMLVRRDGVLLCHRSAGRTWYPDVWDLPGGHVEGGETPAAALVREVREELGVVIAEPEGPPFARIAGSDFELSIWVFSDWVGVPSNLSEDEHDEVRWFPLVEATGLRFAHHRYPDLIARALG